MIERPEAIRLEKVAGEVELCNVSFKYGEEMLPVLDGLSLHIKAGETIALVGPSGGGKTTLIKLLLRLYEPSSGTHNSCFFHFVVTMFHQSFCFHFNRLYLY